MWLQINILEIHLFFYSIFIFIYYISIHFLSVFSTYISIKKKSMEFAHCWLINLNFAKLHFHKTFLYFTNSRWRKQVNYSWLDYKERFLIRGFNLRLYSSAEIRIRIMRIFGYPDYSNLADPTLQIRISG